MGVTGTSQSLPSSAEKADNEEPSETVYPRGHRLAIVIASLAASVFLCALDETIIVTAIPKITDEFKSINDVGLYGSAYFMTFAAFQLIYGKLFSFYSIKSVFLVSILIFEVGSLICGTAPGSTVLIIGRAFAGLGSAGINAGFIIILAASLPLERRPLFVGCYSGMYGLSAIVAPLLGGALTTHASWRWCFYINLPVGGAAIVSMWFFLRVPSSIRASSLTWLAKLSQMDLLGTVLLLPGVICLLLALQWGGSLYKWNSVHVVSLLVASAVALAGFTAVQFWKGDQGTVPPRIIKQRSVACSTCYVFQASGAVNIFQYFLPVWFQAIQDVTPFDSGTRILPTTLSIAAFSFIAGFGVAKTGYYTPFMIFGAAVLLTGSLFTTTWRPATPASQWITYQVILGAGAGLGIQQAHTAAQTVLAAEDVPTGAVVLIFAHTMGNAIWLSVAQNVFTGRLLAGLLQAEIPGLDTRAVLDGGVTGLKEAVDGQYLDRVIEVYNGALTKAFLCGAGLTAAALAVSLGMEWRSIKKRT